MNLKFTLAALAATATAANAATLIVDNLDLSSPVTAGAQSNYTVQSFTPSVAGIGTSDNITANTPLPGSVYLESVTFLSSPDTRGDSTNGQIFIDVYLGDGDDGTYIGSSTNSIDIDSIATLTEMTWNFANFELDSSQEYAFVFSTDNVQGATAVARLTAANNGGGFVNTYDGGTADFDSNNNTPVAFDTRFQVTMNTIPEPSSAALLGVAGLALIMRRRK